MNTAVARRLALGDRVVWIGKDGYQPTGLGTITRITAHEVEVRWDGETVTRYRRAHLHNLRHAKLISETVESGRRSAHNSPETFHFRESLRETSLSNKTVPPRCTVAPVQGAPSSAYSRSTFNSGSAW
jgi:hypothetical protein